MALMAVFYVVRRNFGEVAGVNITTRLPALALTCESQFFDYLLGVGVASDSRRISSSVARTE